jgi:hypothetical protein
MSQRPTGFDTCLPGIVAGLTLAAVLLAMGEAEFPDPFRQVCPRQTLVLLCVAIGAASAVGLVSLSFHSRGDEENPQQHIPSNDSKNKNALLSGGTDAF